VLSSVAIMTPVHRLQAALETHGSRRQGRNWRCPAHDDRQASLSVAEGRDGRAVLHCHAGCETETVLKALDLELADLFPPKRHTAKREIAAAYQYVDEHGALLFEVVRYLPKAFRQRRRARTGDPPNKVDRDGWVWSLGSTRRVLYRLPEVLAAVQAGQTVWVVEGERDVHVLEAVGVMSTCNPMGAGKWREEYAQALAGATVVVVADRDQAGHDHARTVAASLERAGCAVRLVQPAVDRDHADVADHLAAGLTLADLLSLDQQPETRPAEDGAALLEEVYGVLERYVVFPSGQAAVAVTLWVAASHAQPAWEHATRLAIKSPVKRCGKSRLLDLLEALCHNPLLTVNISPAALVRTISEDDPPTVLVDETDTVFGKRRGERSDQAEDLRGILNAGHQRGRPYIRWDPAARRAERCPTYAMAALAGIGDLPDTVEDRAVVVQMRRRAPGEQVTPLRRRDLPALVELRDRLHAFIRGHLAELEAAMPAMPVEDRAADVWEPLVAVSDLAGGGWPELARAACRALASDAAEADDGSLGERLLRDLRVVFGGAQALWTTTVIERLAELDEAPWADYYGQRVTDRAIAKLLRPYRVRSRTVRLGAETRKGYAREDLVDAWQRYSPPAGTSGTSDTSQVNHVPDCDAPTTSVTERNALTSEVTHVTHVPDTLPDDGRLPGVDPDPRRFAR
jgi:5S rRNA maturation endonuclease (ribonuclease M5)